MPGDALLVQPFLDGALSAACGVFWNGELLCVEHQGGAPHLAARLRRLLVCRDGAARPRARGAHRGAPAGDRLERDLRAPVHPCVGRRVRHRPEHAFLRLARARGSGLGWTCRRSRSTCCSAARRGSGPTDRASATAPSSATCARSSTASAPGGASRRCRPACRSRARRTASSPPATRCRSSLGSRDSQPSPTHCLRPVDRAERRRRPCRAAGVDGADVSAGLAAGLARRRSGASRRRHRSARGAAAPRAGRSRAGRGNGRV